MEGSEKKQYNGSFVRYSPEWVDNYFNSSEDVSLHTGNESGNDVKEDVQNYKTIKLPPFTGDGKSKGPELSHSFNTSKDKEELPKPTIDVKFGQEVLEELCGKKWIYVKPDEPISISFDDIFENSTINLELLHDKHSHRDTPVECFHNCPSDYQNAHRQNFELKEGQTITGEFLNLFLHSFSVEIKDAGVSFHRGKCVIPIEDGGRKEFNLRVRCNNRCSPSKEYGSERKLVIYLTDVNYENYLERKYAMHLSERPDRDIKKPVRENETKRTQIQNSGQKKRKLDESD